MSGGNYISEINNDNQKKPLKALDRTSKIGKVAFKFAFGGNIFSVLAFILIYLKIFSIYAIIACAVSLAISLIGYIFLLIDIEKFNQHN